MDQSVLVNNGHELVRALDTAGLSPQIAMWVHDAETDAWKLWIVPPEGFVDALAFYRKVAEVIAKHRSRLGDLSAGDIKLVQSSHPAMQGIGRFFSMHELGSGRFSGNLFDGFYLPEGVILRAELKHQAAA